jgi:hypothetical protein
MGVAEASTMQHTHAQAQGNRIILQFDSLDEALRLFSPWRGAAPRAQAAAQIHKALEAVGLAVEVRVKDRAVAQLGEGEPRGALFSLLQPAA